MKRFVTSELSLDTNNYALPAGNLSWDSTNGLRIHDGSTAGGNPVGGGASGNSLVNGGYTVALSSATGVLSLSTASTIQGNSLDPNVYIETVSGSGTTSTWTFGTNGVLTLPAATPVIQGGGTGTDVTIVATNNSSTTATWVFHENGSITFPDTSVQTKAYPGSGDIVFSNGTLYNSAGNSIAINPGNGITSYIIVPNFQDGGETLTIANEYSNSNGINFILEGGSTFTFKGTNFTLPAGGDIKNSSGVSVLSATTSTLINGSYNITLGSDGILNIGSSAYSNSQIASNSSTPLLLSIGGTGYSWMFNIDGRLILPGSNGVIQFTDGTQQTTAWTGTVAYSNITGTPNLSSYTTTATVNTLIANSLTNYTTSTLYNGSSILKITPAPSSLLGASGDVIGQIAFDTNYLYYAYQNYSGTTYTMTSITSGGGTNPYITMYNSNAGFTTADLTGYTVTGPGPYSGTVTGPTQNMGGNLYHIPVTPSLSMNMGNYVFTSPSGNIWGSVPFGAITSATVKTLIANSLTNYTTTASVNTLIANSLTNYTTTASVNTLIANSLTNYTTTASVNTLIANSLTSYSTTVGVNTLIANSLTSYLKVINTATASVVGGIKVGSGLSIAGDGTLSVQATSTSSGAMNYYFTTTSVSGSISAIGQTITTATFTTNGYPVYISLNGDANPGGSSQYGKIQFYRDGVAIGNAFWIESGVAGMNISYNISTIDTPIAGSHTYTVRTVGAWSGSFTFGEAGGPQWEFIELSGAVGPAGASGSATTSTLISGSYTATLSSSTGVLTATAFSGDGSRLTNLNYTATGSIVGTLTNVQLVAGTNTWTFSSTGTVVFPDGSQQTTAYTGTSAISTATASTVGGIKVGSGLSITGDGTLSVSNGGSATTSTLIAGSYTATLSSSTGVLTATAFSGDGSRLTNLTYTATNNVVGTNTNVQLIAGSNNYTWTFDSSGNLTLPNVLNPQITTIYTNSNIVLNPNGVGDVILTTSTQLLVNDTATSTSTTTGAVIVGGGVGIGGNLNAGSNNNTTTQHTLLSGVQLAPNATAITANATIAIGGAGGNYLAIGQYPSGATYAGNSVSYAQWIQSGYGGNNTPYALVLNPTGGSVIVPGGGTVAKASTATLALNTSITLDNLAIQIKTQSSGVWIFAATVSGTATYQYSITYQTGSGSLTNAQGDVGTISATTTPAVIGLNSWFFNSAGTAATTILTDTTANKMYRITWMTTSGSSPYGNYVTIERL
jgi:hypothetical protein